MNTGILAGIAALALIALLVTGSPARADLDKGLAAAEAGDFATALSEIRPAAADGDPEAQFFMGVMYDSGSGVPRDLYKAAHWYERAAEQGITAAQYNLGLMYAQGQGLPRDLVGAYKWLAIAARNGDADALAQQDLAATLMSAEMINEAQQEADKWLESRE